MTFLNRAVLMVLAAALVQGQPARKASPDSARAAAAVKKIEGVYKKRFANSTVHEEKFESEDILEIVPYGAGKIYFRIHLEFYNAHLCDLQGIAPYEDGSFVYRGSGDRGPDICKFTITPGRKDITLDDIGGNCRALSCGARGGYHGAGFPLTSRRAIRYMARLKASKEYGAAVAEFEQSSAH